MPSTGRCWCSIRPAGTPVPSWRCRRASTWSSCPPASPELQPAERLWPLVDEPVANRAFPDLEALEAVLVARCRTLEADWARLKAHTHFHWWPAESPPVLRQ